MRFRRKPALVDAFRWNDQAEIPAWLADAISRDAAYRYEPVGGRPPQMMIRTSKGVFACHKGDWIVRARDGALSISDHDEFGLGYDVASNAVDWEEIAKGASKQASELQSKLHAAELALAEARNEAERLRQSAP